MKPLILILSLILFASVSYGQVYKWTDESGKVHFSDTEPESSDAEKQSIQVNTYTHVSFEHSISDVGPKVIMYSTQWCTYCKKAKAYFQKNNISFTEYDIEKNAKAKRQYDKIGGRGVPVILVGSKRMNGFSESGFERIYQ